MVDVGPKVPTRRTAIAQSMVIFPPEVLAALNSTEDRQQISDDGIPSTKEWIGPKGPIFATAITAGIMGVKQTSSLIPLCHPLPIENIHIDITWYTSNTIQIKCTCSVTHKTGVEMEALMGCSIAALTIYDMVKAISHNVQITDTKLLYKDGGKRHVDER
jgi:cyclic pyranopterin phosphate synthase